MRSQQRRRNPRQEADLHPRRIVVERGDVVPTGIHRFVEIGQVGEAVLVVGIVQVARSARLRHHVNVLAPAAVCYLPSDDVARILERFVTREPLRRMVSTQRKHAAAARRMFGAGVARGFLLVGQRLLVDGLLFLRALQILQPSLLLFLRQGRDALAIYGLGDHVHANYFGGRSGGKAQGNKRSQEQKEQGSAMGRHGLVSIPAQLPLSTDGLTTGRHLRIKLPATLRPGAERRLRARPRRKEWVAGRC